MDNFHGVIQAATASDGKVKISVLPSAAAVPKDFLFSKNVI
jgi:hypothetical protein